MISTAIQNAVRQRRWSQRYTFFTDETEPEQHFEISPDQSPGHVFHIKPVPSIDVHPFQKHLLTVQDCPQTQRIICPDLTLIPLHNQPNSRSPGISRSVLESLLPQSLLTAPAEETKLIPSSVTPLNSSCTISAFTATTVSTATQCRPTEPLPRATTL